MKIKHKLYASGAASILLMLLIGAVIFVFSNRVERENQKLDVAQGVLREVSELGFLTNEYLLNREETSEEKWNSKYNAVAKILVKGEKEETEPIRLDFIFVGDMFLQVTRNYDRTCKS